MTAVSASSTAAQNPTVTLVIPSYNRGARILPTIQSALRQTRSLDEIIIVNDGGCAETRISVEGLSPIIRVLDVPQGGAPSARNIGAREARGLVLMLLDDDDVLLDHAVETLLDALLAFPEAKASFCDHTFKDWVTGEYRENHFHVLPHYERFRRLIPEAQTESKAMLFGRNLHDVLLQGNLLGQPWMVWRTVYLNLGGFVSGLGSADDWDLYLRLTRHHKVAVVDRVASNHFREAGRAHLTTAEGQERVQLAVAIRQVHMAGLADVTAQWKLRKKIGRHYKTFGDIIRDTDPAQARRHYWRSTLWWPFDPVAVARVFFPKW